MELSERQLRALRRINWDYVIPVTEMLAVLRGQQERAGHWSREDLLLRMLDQLSWYELLDFFSARELAEILNPEFLSRLRNREKREKYERLGKILRNEPVSFTRWGPEYRRQIRDTLFSDRWYST